MSRARVPRGCVWLLVALASVVPAGESTPQADGATVLPTDVPLLVTNAILVDVERGVVVPDSALLTNGRTIAEIASGVEAVAALTARAPTDARRIDAGGRYLLPGLIDAHVHIPGFRAARRALRSGVTTARSMGTSHFVDVGMRELADTGVVEAPQIVAAGYHVRPQPADGFFLDFPALAPLMEAGVRGPDALRRMAEALISRDVDFIKVNATERAGLPETDPRKPFYDEEELHALVEAAGGAGVPVAAHAHGDAGGRAAVLAGVRSIEHGTYLSEQTLRLMAERGTYLVPTVAVVADLTVPGGDYDDPVLNIRGRHMLPRIRETVANAYRLGVPIVAATDTGYGPDSVLRLSHELIELQAAGLDPIDALRAATTVAAELLGVAETTGRLSIGQDADVIAVERNPLQDVAALQDVLLVISDGRVVLDRLAY